MNRNFTLSGSIIFSLLLSFTPAFAQVEPTDQESGGQRPSLNQAEVYYQDPNLKASLHISKPVLRITEMPTFTLRLQNAGQTNIYVNPEVVTNLYLYDATGKQVPPVSGAMVCFASSRSITERDLIELLPGEHWETEVLPMYYDKDSFDPRYYWPRGSDGRSISALQLPAGQYSARFVYMQYPGYGRTAYDPYTVSANIWEGKIETTPVSFRVEPLPSEEIQELIWHLQDNDKPDEAIEKLGLSRAIEALPALIAHFLNQPATRTSILKAVQRIGDPQAARMIIEATQMLGRDEQVAVVYSPVFSELPAAAGDCSSLPLLLEHLDSQGGDVIKRLVGMMVSLATRCELVREALKAIVSDSQHPQFVRYHAAYMLGLLGNRKDANSLIKALNDPSVLVQRGAIQGLVSLGGPMVEQALIAALSETKPDRPIRGDLVDALSHIGGPNTIPVLVEQLSATDPYLVSRVISALIYLNAKEAVPALVELLKHPERSIRQNAACGLSVLADKSVRAALITVLDDLDTQGQSHVLAYLVKHGDPSLLPLFEELITSRDDSLARNASEGILKYGMEASFQKIRPILEHHDDEVRRRAQSILSGLTFHLLPFDEGSSGWDTWWEENKGQTRVEWALKALEPTTEELMEFWPHNRFQAIQFLADRKDRAFIPVFKRLTASRTFYVRIEAAKALAHFDRKEAAGLFFRELQNRNLMACAMANRALNELTGRDLRFDFLDPALRRQALEAWQKIIHGL